MMPINVKCPSASSLFFSFLMIKPLKNQILFSLHQFHGDIIFVVHVVLLNLPHFSQSSKKIPFENRFSAFIEFITVPIFCSKRPEFSGRCGG
jgi:hypothetical protein